MLGGGWGDAGTVFLGCEPTQRRRSFHITVPGLLALTPAWAADLITPPSSTTQPSPVSGKPPSLYGSSEVCGWQVSSRKTFSRRELTPRGPYPGSAPLQGWQELKPPVVVETRVMERKQGKAVLDAAAGWGKENQVSLSVLPGTCDLGQVTKIGSISHKTRRPDWPTLPAHSQFLSTLSKPGYWSCYCLPTWLPH